MKELAIEQDIARRGEIIGQYGPRVTTQFDSQLGHTSGSSAQSSHDWQATVAASVPFFTGGQREIDLRTAGEQIEQANLEKAKVDLDHCTIPSPIDGIVISRSVDVGQTVAATMNAPVLFTVANDLAKMQIDAAVAEADVGVIEVGQRVDFSVDAFPYRTFHGDIVQVRNAATTVQNVVTYDVVISVNNADLKLIVGGIGIMNIMLVSVTERTREIGIRMAVGAHGADIMLQFLVEAIALSSLGGVIGILLGVSSPMVLKLISDICERLQIHNDALAAIANGPTLISPSIIIIAFLFSAAVGVFFGLYPARKAAALDPIDALRYE